MAKLFLAAFLAVVSANNQKYPGTSTRPILSESEASHLNVEDYLQGWNVEDVKIPSKPDYVVGNGSYSDIQDAVNAAIKAGGSRRKYIEIQPGTYKQTVFITGRVPITLYGTGVLPRDVKIALHQPVGMEVSQWIAQVNPNNSRYKPGDPAFSVYDKCAKQSKKIGITCSSVVRIGANGVQLYHLEVQNSNGNDIIRDAQSVAVKVEADQVTLSNVGLISRRGTFYAGASGTSKQRIYIYSSQITGDVDIVFGGGTAIFKGCIFIVVSDRHLSGRIVFAPSTHPSKEYGFLVTDSYISGDEVLTLNKQVSLARCWDLSPYVPGKSNNGQLLIRDTVIDGFVNNSAPYGTSTGSRLYNGNAAIDRNLHNNIFNRFWEFGNLGDGS